MAKRGKTGPARSHVKSTHTTSSKAFNTSACLAVLSAPPGQHMSAAPTVRDLSGLRRVSRTQVSTTHAVRQTKRGYMELQPSDIQAIEVPHLSQQLVIRPMGGSQSAGFSIGMASQMLALLELMWDNTFVIDDRRFHEVLRLFASIHYFIGGDGYSRSLSDSLGLSISTVNRWLNGHSSPIPTVRLLAYQESDRLVRRIIEERKLGAEIADYQRNENTHNKRGG